MHLADTNVATSTRRQFCRQAAGSLAAAAAFASSPLLAADTAKKLPPGRYVDVHTHLGTVWNSGRELTAEELLRWMDAANIAQAVVLPLVSPESSSYPISTNFVLAETKPHRDRLIPFCSVDPRTSYSGGHAGLVAMLRRYVDAGARGFGEHKPGVPIDDPRNMALYAACAELKLPVLFHLDDIRNTDAPGLPGLEKALKEFPAVTFIGHGPGWWASISAGVTANDLGGYPRGEVAPGGAIDRLIAKYPNLYGDLSAGSGAGAIGRDLKFGREFLIRRQDRLMFGTDFLAPGQEVPQLELFAQIDLPDTAAAKIFRDNARRMLGLA
ncbi:MAG: amidohydrolase family protein [Planctomycetia bacterium]|nr:amidohydrolase family protein [Planctomycetia bacterium]